MAFKRAIDPDVAWPHLCAEGRKLRWACEQAQDYVEKAKGKRIISAQQAKDEAEAELTAHLDSCESCEDRRVQTRSRLRTMSRLRALSRSRSKPRRTDAPKDSRVRPARYDPSQPETHPVIQYALIKLEGRIVRR